MKRRKWYIGILIFSLFLFVVGMNRYLCVTKRRAKSKWLIRGALMFCVLWFCPFPQYIDRELSGVCIDRETGEEMTEEKIQIEGWYFRYLFRDYVFRGEIHIDSIDPQHDLHMTVGDMPVSFTRIVHTAGRYGVPAYYSSSQNRILSIGSYVIQGAFRQVLFMGSEESEKIMVFPAESSEDAMKILNELKWAS